jgi:hypothetical protein
MMTTVLSTPAQIEADAMPYLSSFSDWPLDPGTNTDRFTNSKLNTIIQTMAQPAYYTTRLFTFLLALDLLNLIQTLRMGCLAALFSL